MADSNTVDVSSPLGETIVQHEFAKQSFSSEASEHAREIQKGIEATDADAERSKPRGNADDDQWHNAVRDRINQNKPFRTEAEIQAEKQANAAGETKNAEEEVEVEDEEEEQEAEINPLDQFSPEKVAELAAKFGLSEDDLQSPAVQRMLADRLQGSEETPPNEVKAPTTEAQRTQEQYQAHFAELQRISTDPNVFDPVVTEATIRGLADCFGAETPEDMQNVQNLSSVLGQAGINLAANIVPQIMSYYFNEYLEHAAPGLMEQHRNATAHNIWMDLKSSNADYASLPNVDSEEFTQLREKVLADNPFLETLQYKDANGNVLNPWHPQAVRQSAALFAKLAVGQRMTKETAQKLIDAGKQQALGHSRRVSASRSFGSGRSQGAFKAPAGSDFLDAIHAYNKSQRSFVDDEGE